MGCNESKHNAVVTGNTVLRRKQSDKSTKDIETVKENLTAEITSTADHDLDLDRDHDHANDVVGHENDVASTVVAEKNLDRKKESEKEDQQLVDQGDNHDHDVQRLIGQESPNHFFSSRKDEETGSSIDGIVSEGRSGKSEYNTPRQKDDDDDHDDQEVEADDQNNVVKVDDNHDHVDADHVQNIDQKKELADDENQDQSKAAEENDKSRNLEQNAVLHEEPPIITTAESDISSSVEKEKSTTSTTEEEQHVVDSSAEESKRI